VSRPPKPLDLDALDKAAAAVCRAREAATFAFFQVAHEPDSAKQFATTAAEQALSALNYLEALGAAIPGPEGSPPVRSQVPLHLMDTPAARRLVEALEETARIALEVDQERGWIDSNGESAGYADTIGGMALGLRTEVYGPRGRE
jgi:hypothetical protein